MIKPIKKLFLILSILLFCASIYAQGGSPILVNGSGVVIKPAITITVPNLQTTPGQTGSSNVATQSDASNIVNNITVPVTNFPFISTNISLAGQTSTINSTLLTSHTGVGLYRISGVELTTTPSGAGTPTISVTISWTDEVGATSTTVINAASLSSTGRTAFSPILISTTGNTTISYSTSIASAAGTPQYTLKLCAELIQ